MSLFLGIDTSNYTTSVALFDSETGEMRQNKRLLPVREGQLGLRQSDAVFHHTAQLHRLFEGGVCGYAQAVAAGMEAVQDEIDADISRFLKKGWSLSRISRTSLTILRLALYEIKYLDSIPESVSVNEAVELAKKYTIDESGFVNGILGSFIRSREGDAE